MRNFIDGDHQGGNLVGLLYWLGKRYPSVIVWSAVCALVIVLEVSPVVAATFIVNSTDWDDDANPGDGICANISGNCTFRAAIREHNASLGGANTLILPSNTYRLLFAPKPRVFRGSLTIIGEGASTTIIDGGGFDTVLGIYSASVNISGVTVTHGGYGGLSVWSDASLNLKDSVVIENFGGGITNLGVLVINNSTISYNAAIIGGGITNSGNLSISNSTIHNNTATHGAGIAQVFTVSQTGSSTGSAALTNVTISANTAADMGGGIVNSGANATMVLMNTTISNNSATSGGGIFNDRGTITLKNTIIANTSQGGNCGGAPILSSTGHNLSSDNTCNLGSTGDRVGINPNLASLSDTGGITLTHALLQGSPAIDAGDPTFFPATDQRGITRPQGMRSDIGAYELVSATPVPTMTQWGMILFAAIAGPVSFCFLRR